MKPVRPRRAPACTEKRKPRFIQRDRPEAGVEPARKNYGYFFPEIGLSVRLKILYLDRDPAMNTISRAARRARGGGMRSGGVQNAAEKGQLMGKNLEGIKGRLEAL